MATPHFSSGSVCEAYPEKSSEITSNPVPNPEKISKQKKTSQKGASGSGKPKKTHASLKDKVIAEDIRFEDLEPNTVSKEIPSEINRAPCSINSPLDLNPKKASYTFHQFPSFFPSISLLPIIQSTSILPHIPVMAG